MKGRIQYPKYTAAALAVANPVLLDGEIVYESDTGRCKMGDGSATWLLLPYRADAEMVPGLVWKVQDGMLYVKPATDINNPILKRCSVGILHYKNARTRIRKDSKTGLKFKRPANAGFKMVQDRFARQELSWTSVNINPVPFDVTKTNSTGWMPLIRVQNLINRWVEYIPDPDFSGNRKYILHRGTNTGHNSGAVDEKGKLKMQVAFYAGVVLFVGNEKYRIEGPRSYFKVVVRNYDSIQTVVHI